MIYTKGDFHLHTTASDGRLSPEELVNLAKVSGIDIIAVTDHDTTLGVGAAIVKGNEVGVKVIPGIELSTNHNGESIHILGFFCDRSYESSEFQNFLHEMKSYRVVRAQKIIDNINTYFKIKLDYDRVYEKAKGIIARPHIARAIIEAGYNYSWDYIFEKIIGKDSPAYVPNKKVSVSEGLSLLKAVNAITVLAHPVLIKKSKVDDLVQYGFDGIEAIYPLNSEADNVNFERIAKEHNLLITAGSDFHGGDKGDTKHGYVGCVSLDAIGIERLLLKTNSLRM